MVNCPNCGVLVEKDSKFCQECGTKIDNSDSNTQTDVSSDYEKNKRIFCGYDGNCFCHKTGWNFDRCDRSAFRRDHRDADLTAQKCKIWLW